MRNIRITGCGAALPDNTVKFKDQTRYRMTKDMTLLDLIEKAAKDAVKDAGLTVEDIDLILGATATPLQPIPCNASLLHERIAKGTSIPAFDINSSCTSFVTAFDTASYFLDSGKYKNILIFSGDAASKGLNINQKESYELFSDAAAAFVVTKGDGQSGIINSKQVTYSEGAHDTEIYGGGSILHATELTAENKEDYYFDMKGKKVLLLAAKKTPRFLASFLNETGITLDDIDYIIPHQASKALNVIMERLGIPEDKYFDRVKDWGNMISASIPMALYASIREGRVKRGDKIALFGTAAGLTINILYMVY